MNYILNIYRNNKQVNQMTADEIDVLKQYFWTKEKLSNTKVKNLSYTSDGTIKALTIQFGSAKDGNRYEFLKVID